MDISERNDGYVEQPFDFFFKMPVIVIYGFTTSLLTLMSFRSKHATK